MSANEVICLSSEDEYSDPYKANGDKLPHKDNGSVKRKKNSHINVDQPKIKRSNLETCKDEAAGDNEGEDLEIIKIVSRVKKPVLVVKEKLPVHASNGGQDVFSMFLSQCLLRDKSNDMKKIVEKLKRRYEQLDTEYAFSNEFAELLNDKRNLLMVEKGLVFQHIAEIMDEMKLRKKRKGSAAASNLSSKEVTTNRVYEEMEGEEEDAEVICKKERKIRMIEKAMLQVEKKIKKYEEAEVDLDDDENSTFLITERFKRRMVELHAKWCELTGNHKDAGRSYLRPIHLKLTGIVTVDQAINSFINSKLAQKTNPAKKSLHSPNTLVFPDYIDILKLLHAHNISQNLGMNAKAEKTTAKAAFIKLGEYLKSVRQRDFYDTFSAMYEQAEDPAIKHEELMSKLRENRELGEKKLNTIFEEYSKKQEIAKSLGIVDDPNCISDKEDEEEDGEENEDEEEDKEENDVKEIDDADDEMLKNNSEYIAIIDEIDEEQAHSSSARPKKIESDIQADIDEVNLKPHQIKSFVSNLTEKTYAVEKPILKLRSFAKPPGFWHNSQDNTGQNDNGKFETLVNLEPEIMELDVTEKQIPQQQIVKNDVNIKKSTEHPTNVQQKLSILPKSSNMNFKIFRRLITIPKSKLTSMSVSSLNASNLQGVPSKQTCLVPMSAIRSCNQKASRPVAAIVGQRKVMPESPMTPKQDTITKMNSKIVSNLCINPIAKCAQGLKNKASPSTTITLVKTIPIMTSNKRVEGSRVKILPHKVINPLVKQQNIENVIIMQSSTKYNKNISSTVSS